jgi:Rha family phage regulatory protein
MKPLYPDLFPETLLVNIADGQAYTTSRKIAKHFRKQHRDVLKAIRNVINRTKDPRRLRNFALSSYLNAQGKSQPEYRLTKDGFYFIAAGFTGPEADEWKWDFIDAFNAMEAALQAKTTRFAKALDQLRPCLRPVVEGTEAGRSRAEIAAPLERSPAAVTYHRRAARRLGLLNA